MRRPKYTFEEGLTQLRQFLTQRGRFPFREEDRMLTSWMSLLRVEYELGELNNEQIIILNQLEFVWDKGTAAKKERTERHFEDNFKAIVDFRQKTGRFPNQSDDAILYSWMGKLRQDYKKNFSICISLKNWKA